MQIIIVAGAPARVGMEPKSLMREPQSAFGLAIWEFVQNDGWSR